MHAFHTDWTAPYQVCNPRKPYEPEPLSLLSATLSALSWQQHNGSIRLFTDEVGMVFYQSYHLDTLWNDGIHLLPTIPSSVSPTTFWAAGKLYALSCMQTPCVMLDTDFIVWKNITPLLSHTALAVIHTEPITPSVYPDASFFVSSPSFDFTTLDWNAFPCNTALSYFGDVSFKEDYVSHAFDFMEHTAPTKDRLCHMVFAEQRLLAMRASHLGITPLTLASLANLLMPQQSTFTHLWGYKETLRKSPKEYHAFCCRCAKRIQTDYPHASILLKSIPTLTAYF